MTKKFVSNACSVFGVIKNIDSRENATSLDIETEYGDVKVFAFPPAKLIVDKFSTNEAVFVGATIQSDNSSTGFPNLTLVANHISYGNLDAKKSVAKLNIHGRVVAVNKIAPDKATALIRMKKDDKTYNLIRVYFYSENEEKINKFSCLDSHNFLSIYGYLTGEKEAVVTSWRHEKPN